MLYESNGGASALVGMWMRETEVNLTCAPKQYVLCI